MNKVRNNIYFIFTLISITVFFLLYFFKFGVNIYGDGLGYYEYFIRIFVNNKYINSGIIKYPIGTMIMQLPFTLPVLFFSRIFGIDVDGGYSQALCNAVFISALFYFLVMLIIIYKFLCEKYSSISATITIVCISLGTMMPVYVCEKSSYSHIYGCFLCTCFFIYVSYYEKQRNNKNKLFMDILLGVIIGGCAIVRNTNVIIGMAYLFYGVTSLNKFKLRLKTIFSSRIVFQIIGFFSIYMIQIISWRVMGGRWMINGYGDEHFTYIRNPQVLSVLFSDAKGLFIYSPILFFAIIGMIAFRRENDEYSISQWLIFVFITYIISAWWCWWLGCAYGERMYCDVLCIFVLPLCGFIENLNAFNDNIKQNLYGNKIIAHIIPIFIYFVMCISVVLNLVWINGVRLGTISDNLGSWYELHNAFFKTMVL